MENAGIIQFLVVVGVLGYGIWSAVQKSKKMADSSQGGGVPSRHLGGENFPFPASTGAGVEKVSGFGDADNDEAPDKAPVGGANMEDRLAVASIQLDAPEDSPYNGEVGENKIDVNLRTMIISSELLKPKYQEY